MSEDKNEIGEEQKLTTTRSEEIPIKQVAQKGKKIQLKKGWTDYLFEFTVPFLAVTAAFLLNAERESYVERQLERQYLNSMIEDLQLDTAYMNSRKKFIQITINRLDTLIKYLSHPEPKTIYKIYNASSGFMYAGPIFRANDRTLQQLKNTGGLRLIRNKDISDKIVVYDRKIIENIMFQELAIESARNDCKEVFGEILEVETLQSLFSNDFKPLLSTTPVTLVSNDKVSINRFLSRLFALRLLYSYVEKNSYQAGLEYCGNFINALHKEKSGS